MIRFKHTIGALLLTMVCGVAMAQNNTNSPYTRYGYGDLTDPYSGNSRAMGGVAYGLRDGMQINSLNPASYTAIDSLTYLFEGSVTLQNTNVSSGGVKLNAKNSSFDYLAMQLRLHPRLAMSIGLSPFSNVGYSVSDTGTATDDGKTVSYYKSYTGDGGLHQIYAGLGGKIFDNLSVGVNVSYFWGDINRSRRVLFPSVAITDYYSYEQNTALSISDYKLDFGAQYTHKIGKKHSVTVGAVYSPKRKLNNDYSVLTYMLQSDGSNSSVVSSTTSKPDAVFELPSTFGLGATYNFDNRLTIGADYSLQQWSKANFGIKTDDKQVDIGKDFAETYTLGNRSKLSIGAEYIPNLLGRSFFSHVKYRAGAYISTPYYKIDGKKAASEYGVTAGFGLPVPRSRSIVSVSGQFVRVKGAETNMVTQNIFRVSIGITFNETWFFKRKVQ